jgi:hypothetical protein
MEESEFRRLLERTRMQINRLLREIARLSDQRLVPVVYFHDLFQHVQRALASVAGAVWMVTPQGHVQLLLQNNLRQSGIDASDSHRERHAELLRNVVAKGQPDIVQPQSDVKALGAGNPTDHVLLLVPILVENQVQGLIEILLDAKRSPLARGGYMHFLVQVAGVAAGYLAKHRNRQG